MAKNTPIITHTEILCLATEAIKSQLQEWGDRLEKVKGTDMEGMVAEMHDANVARLAPKLQALKELYKIETGADYI